MKNNAILLVLISTFSFSQNKEYHFDYLIEYEITFHQESVTRSKLYLTNSKDNSFLGIIKESDSVHFELILRHHNNIYSKVNVLKSDIYNAKFIYIDCKNVISTKGKYKIKEDVLESLKDTLIDGTTYYAYKLELKNKPKKKKKYKGLVTKYFIIDKSTAFHLPIIEDVYEYQKWKINKYIPNGIFNELNAINLLNEPHSNEKLKSYHLIDKKIVLTGGCSHL